MHLFGDNGIISNAQNATVLQSCAVLSEFLNEEYLNLVSNDLIENDKEVELTPIESLQTNLNTRKYFYIPSQEGVGGLRYIVNSDGNALYLIKKSGLPDEIRKQLNGGEAGDKTYQNYASMIDVYGVTSDLQVYYCSDGKESMKGVNIAELDMDNPLREVFGTSDPLTNLLSEYDKTGVDADGNYVMGADGKISAEEVKSITSLKIDSSVGITNLSQLYNLTSLKSLVISDVTLTNLDGIENASKLTDIFFQSCVIENYEALGRMR